MGTPQQVCWQRRTFVPSSGCATNPQQVPNPLSAAWGACSAAGGWRAVAWESGQSGGGGMLEIPGTGQTKGLNLQVEEGGPAAGDRLDFPWPHIFLRWRVCSEGGKCSSQGGRGAGPWGRVCFARALGMVRACQDRVTALLGHEWGDMDMVHTAPLALGSVPSQRGSGTGLCWEAGQL